MGARGPGGEGRRDVSSFEANKKTAEIDALNLLTFELNTTVRHLVERGAEKIIIRNVFGQRYIGTRLCLERPVELEVFGTPGNDLGAFLNGQRVVVHGNAQDGVGNTMNSGEVVVHGGAGDILGLSARGGCIFVRDSVGYRAGVHMKGYMDKIPVVVIGGTAQGFLGEYMAGGTLLLLGLGTRGQPCHEAHFVGAGMHGGTIYIRGQLRKERLSSDVEIKDLDEFDYGFLDEYVGRYSSHFGVPKNEILDGTSILKLGPLSKRPYGALYRYKREA